MIGDWIYDHLGWLCIAMILILVGAVIAGGRSINNECNEMMKLARSSHDSLEVRIACNNMHSDFTRNIAIGAAAGSIASRK